MDGANFTHDSNRHKKKARYQRPFVVDERPPPIISLEWLSLRGLFRFSFYATSLYFAVDATRYLLYRFAPSTIPFQPSIGSTIISTSTPLSVPCLRYTSSDLVVTESAVEHDTAPYLPTAGSTTLHQDLPHHKPRRTGKDRLNEVRDFFGVVADHVANSIVIFSGGMSPSELGWIAPPKEQEEINLVEKEKQLELEEQQQLQQKKIQQEQEEKEKERLRQVEFQQHQQQKLDPYSFDAPPSTWPTRTEQDLVAEELTQRQNERLTKNEEDIWGRKKHRGDTTIPAGGGIPGIVSWSSSTSADLVQRSADFGAHSADELMSRKHELEGISGVPEGLPMTITEKLEYQNRIAQQLDRDQELSAASSSLEGGDGGDYESSAEVKSGIEKKVKDVHQLPTRDGSDHHDEQLRVALKLKKMKEKDLKDKEIKNSSSSDNNKNNDNNDDNSSNATTLREDSPSAIDAALHRFMTLHFRPPASSFDSPQQVEEADDRAPAELRVKCVDASSSGGLASRCTVDAGVLCAPRHRAMLAALALLPDPLPTHLQVATFGVGPTVVASFIFKFFAQHLKRLDVVTEPALLEHSGILDFGLSARNGPISVFPTSEENFLLRTDKKYDLLFLSATDQDTGRRRQINDMNSPVEYSPDFVALVRKSLSSVGVAAFELHSDDWMSARTIRDTFGMNNVFFIPVTKSGGNGNSFSWMSSDNNSNKKDLVAIAGYSLPQEGVWKRHIVQRAEDLSYTFRLPYDIGAHLPISWIVW